MTDSPTDVYEDYLSDIEALINQRSHAPVIIAGDFNAHVGLDGGPRSNDKQNTNGKLLYEVVHRNDLCITSLSGCTRGPCYTFFQGDTVTTTDYIITNALSTALVDNCAIQNHHLLNSSDHLP